MPTYEYQCRACDHTFEKFQSITAKPVKKCPQCGKMKVVRLLGTGAGIIFKGSGFYETDYRSDSYRKGAESEKPKSDKKSEFCDSCPAKEKCDTAASTKSENKTKKPKAKPA